MATRYIPITISNELVYGDGVSVGAKGSNDDVILQITFSEFWDGLSKHITWENAHGEKTIVYFSNDMFDGVNYNIPVPVEAKRYEGDIHASIRGTLSGRSSMTALMTFIVQPAIYDSQYEEEQNPTGTIADQLQEQMDAQQDEISRISEMIDLERLEAIADQAYEAYVNATEALILVRDSAVLGVKGNLEESYRTGQVNLTPADIGAVALESGKALSTNDFTNAYKTKLDGIADQANKYVHPSYTAVNSGLYKVKVDSTGHVSGTTAVAKTDITGLGIPAQDTVYTHPSYTARTGYPTANASPAFGGSFYVSQITSDGTGHVTGANTRTITIPSTVASTSANGLMTTAMVSKLNGIAEGARTGTLVTSHFQIETVTLGYSITTTEKGNGSQVVTSSANKSGYYPMGIVGIDIPSNAIVPQKFYLTHRSTGSCLVNLGLTIKNMGASSTYSGNDIKVYILWVYMWN